MRQSGLDELRQRFPIGAEVVGTIAARAPFGVFVDVTSEVRALLEVGHMSIDPKAYWKDDPYVVGILVRARVLAVYDDGQIRLTQGGYPPTAA